MLGNVKKYGVIIIIAILFAFFAFSLVDLVIERPDYEDFCRFDKPLPRDSECQNVQPTESEMDDCFEREGRIKYTYDTSGCATAYECDMCSKLYEDASGDHRLVGFIITSILGLIAIIVGLYARSKDEVVEWIFSGFLIGGIFSIFFGTMSYFQDMHRIVKPIVLLLEMVLIVWIALKSRKK